MPSFQIFMTIVGLATMLLLGGIGLFPTFVRLPTDMEDVPLGPLDDQHPRNDARAKR